MRAAAIDPAAAAYGLRVRLNRNGLFTRYGQLARGAGLDRVWLVLSFDCDTPQDAEVVEAVHERLMGMGVRPVYAVPGDLLREAHDVYGRIAATGAEFINHGDRMHTYVDERTGRWVSSFFYDQQPRADIRKDILDADATVREVIGRRASGRPTSRSGRLQWPQRGRLKWPHLRVVVVYVDCAAAPGRSAGEPVGRAVAASGRWRVIAGRARRLSDRLRFRAMESVARSGLRGADLVLPVYEPIVPYLRRLGVKRYEVAYNVVAGRHLRVKDDCGLHEPVRVISVGRLFEAKNPINLIHAVEELPGVELLVVGDGPLRQELQRQAGARVRFAPAIPNAELGGLLAEQDLFATHTDQWEIPKTILEASLTGLPMLLNHRRGKAVPELQAGMAHFVDDSVAGYREGLLEERGRVLSSA